MDYRYTADFYAFMEDVKLQTEYLIRMHTQVHGTQIRRK